MTSTKDLHESEVTTCMSDLTILVSIIEFQILNLGIVESLLSWPLKCQGPGLVTEPIADIVCISCVDENWDLLKDAWDEAMERLEPIPSEQKRSIDIEVARIVFGYLNTKFTLDIGTVEVVRDPAKSRVALYNR